jgi:hypothetical protein
MSNPYSQYVLACLRRDSTYANSLTQTPGWNWEYLLETATASAILPTLASLVCEGLDLSLPADVRNLLETVLALNRERNQHIWSELKNAVALLNKIGMEPVLLKGAAYLAFGVYPDPAARALLDLDLLLPEAQVQPAVDCLVANGYDVDETDKFGRFRHHHSQVHRGSVAIELHHRLTLAPGDSILPAKEVIENSTPIHLDDIKARVPSPSHLAMHLVMHSQMHHPYNERIWPPARAMYDLVRIQQSFGDAISWSEIANRFSHRRQYGLLALHLLDIQDSLGLKMPFTPRMTVVSRIRRMRRSLIRNHPRLRFVDPLYMWSVLFTRRLRLLRSILNTPGGLQDLLANLVAPGVYQRIFSDVLEGRGH